GGMAPARACTCAWSGMTRCSTKCSTPTEITTNKANVPIKARMRLTLMAEDSWPKGRSAMVGLRRPKPGVGRAAFGAQLTQVHAQPQAAYAHGRAQVGPVHRHASRVEIRRHQPP